MIVQKCHLPTFGTGQVVLMSLKCVSTPILIGAGATKVDSSNAADKIIYVFEPNNTWVTNAITDKVTYCRKWY